MFNFCKHKYGKVEDGGYQYCDKCGLAINAPVKECQHKWTRLHSFEKLNIYRNIMGVVYILQCEDCGEIEEKRFTASGD